MLFIDLKSQYEAYKAEFDAAIAEVLASVRFVNGPQVTELERRLAERVGVAHAVSFSGGTASLLALMMALDIGPGDEVITTPFTFIASAEVVALVGAKPVFVDVEPDTLNLDPTKLAAALSPRTRAIMPVNLFGQCADYDAINAVAAKAGVPVLEDACQSLGSTYRGRASCALTFAAGVSFFPSKPLGCYGDGGMAFTNDDAFAGVLRQVREHGQTGRYQHGRLGFNGRLDTLQAAVLLVKLRHFDAEIAARRELAEYYRRNLPPGAQPLVLRPGNESIWAQYTVRVAGRDHVQQVMNASGVPTAVHYPQPVHRQPVFAALGLGEGSFPEAEAACREVLSLPMHPFLTREQQDRVLAALAEGMAAVG
ncbi:MAG: DegT/DnrJ/EryC1/StrS family aminotransferase [Magnetococcus sp. WYHC-3]